MRSTPLFLALFLALTVAVGTYVSAAPEPVLRTVQEAIAQLERDVLDTMRQRDELTAYLMRPSGRQQDSIHMPLTIIKSWEGDSVRVDVPAYVFLLDLEPTMLWTHPVVIVAVPAEVGTSAKTQQYRISGPVLVNGTLMDLGPMCGPNPNRVHGAALKCSYVDTVWLEEYGECCNQAFIIVGAHVSDADSIAFRQDVEMVKRRLNQYAKGPLIVSYGIKVSKGANNAGAKRADVKPPQYVPVSNDSRRYVVVYIGHATQKGPVLSDGVMTWSDFAKGIAQYPSANAHIELATNYGARSAASFMDAGLRGTVLTSTDKDQRMAFGAAQGTPWQQKLDIAYKKDSADINKDNFIEQAEALEYLQTTLSSDEPVLRAKPQSSVMVDTSMPTVGRALLTELQRREPFRLSFRKYVTSTDTVTSVYANNSNYWVVEAREPYEIVTSRDSAGTTQNVVIATVQPVIPIYSEVWLADLPKNCHGVAIRPRYSPPDVDTIADSYLTLLTVAPEQRHRTVYTLRGGMNDERVNVKGIILSGSEYMILSPMEFTIPAHRDVMVTLIDKKTRWFGSEWDQVYTFARADSTRRYISTRVLETLEPLGDSVITWRNAVSIKATSGNVSADSLVRSEVHLGRGRKLLTTSNPCRFREVALFAQPLSNTSWIVGGPSGSVNNRLHSIVVNRLDSVVIRDPNINAQFMSLDRTPLRLYDVTSRAMLRHISMTNIAGSAFNISIAGTDTVRLSDLTIERANARHVDLRADGVLICTDCSFDLTYSRVVGRGRLEQRQNLSALVRTEAGAAIEDAVVHFVSQNGDTLVSVLSNLYGHARPDSLLIATLEEGGLTNHAPIRVLYRDQAGTLHEQVAPHTRRAQVLFVDRSVSSVHEPPAPYTIAPNPVHIGEDVRIASDEMIDHVDLYAIDGTQIATLTPNAVQVNVSTSSLTPGTYICRVTTQSATRAEKIILLP